MFTTCIYCASSLGQNEVIEAFPVGRRLAFDAARGRLWVVCRACERWNLSPLDERWEAIEKAEQLFRDARLRVSTAHVGMARLREGLELIRIGAPQRPEMAAWRYGDQFGRRRKRQLLVTGGVLGAVGALIAGGAAIGVSIGSFSGVIVNSGIWDALVNGRPKEIVASIRTVDGPPLVVQRRHARASTLVQRQGDDQFTLSVEHTRGKQLLTGDDALRAAAQLLPTVNRFGGSKGQVNDAVSYLETAGGPRETLLRIQQSRGANGMSRATHNRRGHIDFGKLPGGLQMLPLRERLALEMALHEEQERRAMEGELQELERVWREAEEIAGISDAMFDTPAMDDELARLKRQAAPTTDSGG